eukprot:17005-Heterococcus_DN1.PRE.1
MYWWRRRYTLAAACDNSYSSSNSSSSSSSGSTSRAARWGHSLSPPLLAYATVHCSVLGELAVTDSHTSGGMTGQSCCLGCRAGCAWRNSAASQHIALITTSRCCQCANLKRQCIALRDMYSSYLIDMGHSFWLVGFDRLLLQTCLEWHCSCVGRSKFNSCMLKIPALGRFFVHSLRSTHTLSMAVLPQMIRLLSLALVVLFSAAEESTCTLQPTLTGAPEVVAAADWA